MFYIDFGGTRPVGSEAEVPAGPAELAKSSNPDHVGGFQVQINLDLTRLTWLIQTSFLPSNWNGKKKDKDGCFC